MSFIVFSDDWGGHPSSCQHLFRLISREHATLWVNTLGLRLPRLDWNDARKALHKLSRMLTRRGVPRDRTVSQGGPQVIAPPMTPFLRPAWLRELGNRSVVRGVRRAMEAREIASSCVVTTVPNVCDVVGRLGARRVVYYCVDDFSEWPGMDRDRVLTMERRLLSAVDHVVCTSQALFDRLARERPCSLLTHGVDVDLFTREVTTPHSLLRHIPEPRVGYYGLFDARSDTELLERVVERLPAVSFVITGPVESCPESLRRLPNLHFTGPVPYAELPALVNGWRACLLPYRLNELTRAINPLKLKEYIATGKPVISTPLPEASALTPLVHIAAEIEPWVEAVRQATSGGLTVDPAALRVFLREHTWTAKAEELLRICADERCAIAAT